MRRFGSTLSAWPNVICSSPIFINLLGPRASRLANTSYSWAKSPTTRTERNLKNLSAIIPRNPHPNKTSSDHEDLNAHHSYSGGLARLRGGFQRSIAAGVKVRA